MLLRDPSIRLEEVDNVAVERCGDLVQRSERKRRLSALDE
jgi:hypothetical protein